MGDAINCLGVLAVQNVHRTLVRVYQWMVESGEEGGTAGPAGWTGCDAAPTTAGSRPGPDACEIGDTDVWDAEQSEKKGSGDKAGAERARASGRVTRAAVGAAGVKGGDSCK